MHRGNRVDHGGGLWSAARCGAASASSGNQVVAATGSVLAFPLARTLTVSVLVTASTAAN
jgi:hypothetical protein